MAIRQGPPIIPATGWTAPLTTIASAAMCFLAVLTLTAAVAADRLAAEWRADLAGFATIRVSAAPEEADRLTAAALQVARTTEGVVSARALDAEELSALLAPWLGAGVDVTALPAPRLIDVTVGEPPPDAADLQARLDREAPGAVYDSHRAWRGPLAEAADSLEALAWIATAFIGVAAAGMVALAARATLAANLEVVRLVRLIGGEDRFIARAFVTRIALRGLAGGLVGAALGVLAIETLPRLPTEALADISLVPDPMGRLAILAAVPLAGAAIAWITARAAIRAALRRLV